MALNANGQEPQSVPSHHTGAMPSTGVIGETTSDCIASVNDISFKRQPLPSGIGFHVPHGAFVRLVLPLSGSDTLTIYELGKRDENGIAPDNLDTRLLITRQNEPVFRFSFRNLQLPKEKVYDSEWGLSAVAMKAAHLCSNGVDITYLVAQAGNQGGFFMAIKRNADSYVLVPIEGATQGRLELKMSTPTRVVVWSAAPEDAGLCTACPKHYVVETMEFDGTSFKVVEKRRTKKTFTDFQDEPLVVSP